LAAGLSSLTCITLTRPSSSSESTPSHGRWEARSVPVRIISSRPGLRRSIGTNMLPGSFSPDLSASITKSEPMPTSSPSLFTSAAPLWSSRGGEVKIASSRRYSQ
jgi:hypothetical protein